MRADNSPQNYQNASDALHQLQLATKLGGSIELSREGNVEVARHLGASRGLNWFVIYLKNLFGFRNSKERTEVAAATVSVINKMKVEVHQLVSERISEIYDIHQAKTGVPLEDDSSHLQENVKRAMATAIQGVHEELKEIEKSIKGGNFNKAVKKWESLLDSVENNSTEKSRALRQELCNEKLGQPGTAVIHRTGETACGEAADRIAAANRSLPDALPEIHQPGQTVSCILSVPKHAPMNMLTDWQQWPTHEKHPKEMGKDFFIGLSEQFHADANRMTFVFETNGFPIECDRDKESVALGFKAALKNNLQRTQMLSHAITQTAFNYIQDTAQAMHPSRSGLPFVLIAGSGIEYNAHRIHMTVEKNGDVSVDYLSFSKCTHLDSELGPLEINRSEKFREPPSRENAGICRSMKIRFRNEDLNRGQLRYEVLEPLRLALRVELPDRESA